MAKRELIKLHPHPQPFFPWAIWFLSTLFQLYRQILIVSPNVMIPELETALKIGSTEVGLIASLAIIPFLFFQIPFGILIDKHGPRRITGFAILTSAIGSLIFALSYNTLSACFGRALIGIGAAASFPNIAKIISNWFKPKQFALILGLTITVAMLGTFLGELTMVDHINKFGWRMAMIHYTIIGTILSILYFIFVRDKDPAIRYDMNPKFYDFNFKYSLKKLLKRKQTWIITAYATFSEAPLPIFIGLWAIPFLTSFYHMSLKEAGFVNSFHAVGLALFAPIFGYFSTKLKKRKIFLQIGTLLAGLSTIYILVGPSQTPLSLIISFFVMGIGVGVIPLCYVIMHERTIPQLTATSIAIVNTSFALLGAAGDQIVGMLLDYHWTGTYSHHLRFYTAESIQHALVRIPLWFAIAFALTFFIKDTKAKQRYHER